MIRALCASVRKLQSWTKRLGNFALSYLQNAYLADLVLLWPLPLPHSGYSCLVEIRNDSAGLQHSFLGGEGGMCGCQCFQELYLEIRPGNVHFS